MIVRLSETVNPNLTCDSAGQFVLSHHTLPGAMSKVIAPPDLPLTFDLSLVWSQQTFDAPSQIWRATSDFNLKVANPPSMYKHLLSNVFQYESTVNIIIIVCAFISVLH